MQLQQQSLFKLAQETDDFAEKGRSEQASNK